MRLAALALLLAAGCVVAVPPNARVPARASASSKVMGYDKDMNRKRAECLAQGPGLLQPCTEQDIDPENCVLRCVPRCCTRCSPPAHMPAHAATCPRGAHARRCMSEACYSEMFPTPIEDGEVVHHQSSLRYKRCVREELKRLRNRARAEGL